MNQVIWFWTNMVWSWTKLKAIGLDCGLAVTGLDSLFKPDRRSIWHRFKRKINELNQNLKVRFLFCPLSSPLPLAVDQTLLCAAAELRSTTIVQRQYWSTSLTIRSQYRSTSLLFSTDTYWRHRLFGVNTDRRHYCLASILINDIIVWRRYRLATLLFSVNTDRCHSCSAPIPIGISTIWRHHRLVPSPISASNVRRCHLVWCH